jgi:hypothetical protein
MVFLAPATISDRVAGWGTWSSRSSINRHSPIEIGNLRVELSSAMVKPHLSARGMGKPHRNYQHEFDHKNFIVGENSSS